MIHPVRLQEFENTCKFRVFVNVPNESVHLRMFRSVQFAPARTPSRGPTAVSRLGVGSAGQANPEPGRPGGGGRAGALAGDDST